MIAPIKRPGVRHVADIPAGAATVATVYEGNPAWIVAPVNEPPYWLLADGTKKLIEPSWDGQNVYDNGRLHPKD